MGARGGATFGFGQLAEGPCQRAHTSLASVPYKIREQATDDVYKAHKANLARKKNGPKHRKWTFKFTNRRSPSGWTIGVVSQARFKR